MKPLDLYMGLTHRLLRLRREQGTSDSDETAWADVLDVIWHDMGASEQDDADAQVRAIPESVRLSRRASGPLGGAGGEQ